MTEFSCLGNLRLRYVGSLLSPTKPLSLNGLIETFIPSEFECRHSRRWPAAAYQLLHYEQILGAQFGGYFVDKELLITQQIFVAANFRLQQCDQHVILH